jgi:tetratricopeptide (TPR) repeat protein
MRTATYLFFAGRAEAGASLLSGTEPLAQRVGESDPAVLGWAHFAWATRAEFNGDPAEYLAHTEAASASFERAGDLRNACTHKLNVGYANMELGALEDAENALRKARASAEVMGLANLVGVANHNLGLVLCRAGSVEEARAVEQAAVDAFEAQKDTRMAAASRSYLACILTDAGDLAGAEAEARSSVTALAERAPVRSLALAILARVLLARGQHEEALPYAEEAIRLFELLEGAEEGEALIRLTHVEALERCGERDRARLALRAAAERLRARSDKIKDEGHRKSFLERIPENARTLALARESGP